MSAQTQTALELRPLRDFPTTPVIIKVGGGGDPIPPGDGAPVEITSDFMPFLESVPGLTWEKSHSMFKGRIRNMVIRDGGKPVGFPQDHPDQLAVVTINYGSERLTVREEGDPFTNDVVLVVLSGEVPFHVTTEPEWFVAKTTFSEPPQSVLFTAGENVIVEISFTSDNPKVLVNFDLDPILN